MKTDINKEELYSSLEETTFSISMDEINEIYETETRDEWTKLRSVELDTVPGKKKHTIEENWKIETGNALESKELGMLIKQIIERRTIGELTKPQLAKILKSVKKLNNDDNVYSYTQSYGFVVVINEDYDTRYPNSRN